jgi:hypothetical protein
MAEADSYRTEAQERQEVEENQRFGAAGAGCGFVSGCLFNCGFPFRTGKRYATIECLMVARVLCWFRLGILPDGVITARI